MEKKFNSYALEMYLKKYFVVKEKSKITFLDFKKALKHLENKSELPSGVDFHGKPFTLEPIKKSSIPYTIYRIKDDRNLHEAFKKILDQGGAEVNFFFYCIFFICLSVCIDKLKNIHKGDNLIRKAAKQAAKEYKEVINTFWM